MVNELFLKSIHSLPGVAAGSETISTRTGRRFGTNNRCRDERMEFYFGHWLHKRILRVYWQRAREEFSNRGSSTRPNYLFIFSHSWCRLFIYLSPEHRHTHTHTHMHVVIVQRLLKVSRVAKERNFSCATLVPGACVLGVTLILVK